MSHQGRFKIFFIYLIFLSYDGSLVTGVYPIIACVDTGGITVNLCNRVLDLFHYDIHLLGNNIRLPLYTRIKPFTLIESL